MGSRDLIIVSIVVVLAIISLRKPWVGVMNWTWLSLMNPHRYAYGIAYQAPLAAIAGGALLLGVLLTKDRQSPFKGAPTIWLLLFAIWISISWLMGYDVAGDRGQWDKAMKIYLMIFVALAVMANKQQIVIFSWVVTFSVGLLAIKGGIFTVMTGGEHKVWGPAGSFIADNNHFALGALMTVPMLHFLQLQLTKRWQRHAMSAAMLLCVASALGSHSRGALLALMAMGAVFWWRSSKKGLIGAAIIVVLLALVPMMPQHWWDRMATIENYEEDGSAMGRINAWQVAIAVAGSHPFGAGMSYQHDFLFQTYGVHETVVRAAHSIYFQILGNHGFIGLFLYLGLWVSTLRLASRIRRMSRDRPDSKWVYDLGGMIQVSLIAYAVGGAFLSMPYYDFPYNLMVMVVLAHRWLLREPGSPEASELNLGFLDRFRRPKKPAYVSRRVP